MVTKARNLKTFKSKNSFNTIEWEEDMIVEGVFKEEKKNVGENKQIIYVIETENDGDVEVWETYQINQFFEEAGIKVGDYVWLQYIEEKKIGGGKTVQQFKFKFEKAS
jgi:hypothetical protein